MPVITGAAVLANWVLFVTLGFGYNHVTARFGDVFLFVSMAVMFASLFVYVGRWQLCTAGVLMTALWLVRELVPVVANFRFH